MGAAPAGGTAVRGWPPIGPPASRRALRALFLAGVGLRLLLAVVNDSANDDHLGVIRILAFEHRSPEYGEHWEAFQPKLYHATVAATWRLFPSASGAVRTRVAQMVACAAGIVTLAVTLRFVRGLGLPAWPTLVTAALVALAPGLVAITAMATNDSFVILFGTLTLYLGWRFFQDGRAVHGVAGLASAILAGLSKGNGLVVPAVVLAVLGLGGVLWRPPRASVPPRRLVFAGFLLLAVAPPVLWTAGPYGMLYRTQGSPFATNWQHSPFPHVFRETYVERPGLTSLAHGLLTFRLLDLLRHPVTVLGREPFPRHRTSLWSQVYGRAHFTYFARWPPKWASNHPLVQNLGRAILLLALLPTGLLVAGLAMMLGRGVRALVRRAALDGPGLGRVLLTGMALAYVAFLAAYAVRLRDFSSMKDIFLYPGLLGFVFLFASAADATYRRLQRHPRALAAVTGAFALLGLGYAMNVGLLIVHLAVLAR